MPSDSTYSREFLVGLLREANIIDEIIDDVVEACEIANYSPFTLASNAMTVPALSEKLSLTQTEAETLKQVTLKRLNAIESIEQSTSSSIEASNTTKISVEVLNSCEEGTVGFKESFQPLERLQDSSKEAKVVQGRVELHSISHWTDCTAEERSPSHCSPKEKISKVQLLEEGVDESSGMNSLADVHLDIAQRPRGRPFIPPLQLKDAGISFGVPKGCHSDASLFDSISSSSSIDQLSPLPLSRSPIKGAKKKQISKRNHRMECPGGIKNSKTPLPSYLRPTVASEARKAATLSRKESFKGSLFKDGVIDHSMVFQSHANGFRKTKMPYSRFVKPTRAAVARMEFIKRRLESTSVEKDKGFLKKRSCSLKLAVHPPNNKAMSRSHAMIAV